VVVHVLIAELLLQPQLVCDKRTRCPLHYALEYQLLLRPGANPTCYHRVSRNRLTDSHKDIIIKWGAAAVQVVGLWPNLSPRIIQDLARHWASFWGGGTLYPLGIINREIEAFPRCDFLFPFGCRNLAVMERKKKQGLNIVGRLSEKKNTMKFSWSRFFVWEECPLYSYTVGLAVVSPAGPDCRLALPLIIRPTKRL
jgi:hypothetical protein